MEERWSVRDCLLAAATVFSLLAIPAASGSDNRPDHANSSQDLAVEHAELLIPGRNGAAAEGYLTIWNGTASQTGLVEVRSDAFGRVSILRTEFREGEPEALSVEGVLPIPGHAELRMRPDGIRLMMTDPITSSAQRINSRLTLVFEGGLVRSVVADVVSTRAALAKHHHGYGDIGPE